MARVPFLTPDLPEPAASANVFRALANSPQMTAGMSSLGGRLLTRGSLDPRLRELAILRVGALLGCDYEFGQHVLIARRIGVSDADIRAARDGDFDALAQHEATVLRYVDAVERLQVDDAAHASVAALLSEEQIVELAVLVGYYGAVSRFLLALDVELDAGVQGLEHP
jgi:4-carboxymuconolactone decarboxylase